MTRFFVATILIATYSTAFAENATAPDARSLLQGVESARLEIAASRLTLRTEYMQSKYTFRVDFEDAKRRFWVTSNNTTRKRMILTGSTVTHFDGLDSVTFHDTNHQNGSLFFDPRLLGITTTYWWNETLAKEIPCHDGTNPRTIGVEEIDGKRCWRVSVVDAYKQRRDFWIDDKNGFRVYRSDFSIPGIKRNSTISTYPDDGVQPWPNRVTTNYYDANDNRKSPPRTFDVLDIESNVKFSDDTWSYSSLDLPIGVPVVDLRAKRRLGYWNGEGLSLSRPRVANQLK